MAETKKQTSKKAGCPCPYVNCARNGNCAKCQEYHRGTGSKTSCGK
ncbi:MAG: hypothetical protein WCV67_14125 [Victivallaceae bacterium]|jgi:hypothetical protein